MCLRLRLALAESRNLIAQSPSLSNSAVCLLFLQTKRRNSQLFVPCGFVPLSSIWLDHQSGFYDATQQCGNVTVTSGSMSRRLSFDVILLCMCVITFDFGAKEKRKGPQLTSILEVKKNSRRTKTNLVQADWKRSQKN